MAFLASGIVTKLMPGDVSESVEQYEALIFRRLKRGGSNLLRDVA